MLRTFVIVVVLAALLATVHAASFCQCVGFVKNHFQFTQSGGNAKDWNPFLASHGWHSSATPSVGAIAVIQPCFGHVSPVYGHIAFVSAWNGHSFTLTGANQACLSHAQSWSSACRTEDDCNNVSDWWNVPLPSPEPNCILFWTQSGSSPAPPPPPPPPAGQASGTVYCVSSSTGLHARSCAGTSCHVEATIPFGQRVVDYGQATQNANGYTWRHVEWSNMNGWVATSYLTSCSNIHLIAGNSTSNTGFLSSNGGGGDNVEGWVVVLSLIGGILAGALLVVLVAFFLLHRSGQQQSSRQSSAGDPQSDKLSILAQHAMEPPAGYRNSLFTPSNA